MTAAKEGFYCPVCGQPKAQHHPTCPGRVSGSASCQDSSVSSRLCEHGAKGCAVKHEGPASIADRAPDADCRCMPDGLMFDAFGNKRVRYVRVIFEGSTCVCDEREAEQYKINDPEGEYEFKDVYLSREEFDNLPEFEGF